MPRTQFLIHIGLFIIIMIGLAACSSLAAPRQIATFPLSTPNPQPYTPPAYNTYLELEVPDVDVAVESAIQLAYQAGGLLVDTQSWWQDGYNHNTIVLAVPSDHSAAFQHALLELGNPIQQQLRSRVISWPGEERQEYVYFTVSFQLRPETPHSLSLPDWAPIRILAKAWSVLTSVLGFLLSILICLAIFVGPFALIGVAVWTVIRSLRS